MELQKTPAREVIVTCRFRPAEAQTLERYAKRRGVSKSALIREGLLMVMNMRKNEAAEADANAAMIS